jgi:type II secretory pathway pseudopilin PulG
MAGLPVCDLEGGDVMLRFRSGITLVEVLVAIFIMGVGLLAILVLFPVGALNMARAIRDDRAQQCGQQAAAIANMLDLRHNQAVTNAFDAVPVPLDAPSRPVMIDPFGATVGLGPLGGSIQRVNPALPQAANNASPGERWFTLLDDLNFNVDGTPVGAPTSVERYGSYTWTYIARRPQHGNRSFVDLSVLVYKGRQTLTPDPEPPFTATGVARDSTLQVTITGDPDLKPLGYILDTSNITVSGVPTVAAQVYQVMDIEKNGTTWTMRVEPPLRNDVTSVTFLEKVIAVFEKGTGWQP